MKYNSIILSGIFFIISSTAWAVEPPTGSVALLCKMSQHSQTLTQTITLDYDQKLADGVSATFTASTISWVVDKGDKKERHQLNRITGIYYYWIENEKTNEPLPAYSCEKVPPKF